MAPAIPSSSKNDHTFRCTFPNCDKTFTRKDHLVRHAANHTQNTYNCPICHRPFKRLDLMQRHEKRNICHADSLGKRRRIHSSSSPLDADELSSNMGRYSPLAPFLAQITGSLPDGVSVNGMVYGSNTGHEISPSMWQPESWDGSLADTLLNGERQDAGSGVIDLSWNVGPSRVQESAERARIIEPDEQLVQRLQASYPEADINLTAVIEAIEAFWSNVAPTCPVIHRGTFDISSAPLELVLMMIITGQASASGSQPSAAHRTVVPRIRGVLVQQVGVDMPITAFQAFCLCHIYDTWHGNTNTLFIAQCMWPVMVSHARKKGIGVAGTSGYEPQKEEAWETWAKDEERRRAAYFVLLLDTQLSTFWNQHPSRQLSVFAHHLKLPCSRKQWDALSPAEWIRGREPPLASSVAKKTRSSFLPGLHPEFQVHEVPDGYAATVWNTLFFKDEPLPFQVDAEHAFTVEVILTGIMAVAWDCRTRGGMGLKFRDGPRQWREAMFHAVVNLRIAWEKSINHVQGNGDTGRIRDSFALSIISALSDIPMLLVAAGEMNICGATIDQRQHEDARRRVRLWAKADDSWSCVWQCARYLRNTITGEWGIFTGWTVYLTTLVIWAFAWGCLPNPGDRLPAAHDPPEAPMLALLDSIIAANDKQTLCDGVGDLLSCAAGRLSTGSDIDRDDAALLWRLLSAHT